MGAHDALEGASYVDEVIVVDQSPIGRTPRSNPVTYLKAFDGIRELFAATRDARARGLTASDFSFNVPGGRCETCAGDGQVRVDMQFLADVSLVCEGLHLGDINELLGCLHRLLEAGATLLVIEHNMDVVKQADWVIDLGPEGGAEGGRLVFQGTPEGLAAASGVSLTSRYLRAALAAPLRQALAEV